MTTIALLSGPCLQEPRGHRPARVNRTAPAVDQLSKTQAGTDLSTDLADLRRNLCGADLSTDLANPCGFRGTGTDFHSILSIVLDWGSPLHFD